MTMNTENQNQIIKCSRCRILKTITEYATNNKTKLLYKSCIQCRESNKKYYKENFEKNKKEREEYSNENNKDFKKCYNCKKIKAISEFYINNIIFKKCNQCTKYDREYKKENANKLKAHRNNINIKIRNNVNSRIIKVIKNKLPDYKIYLGCDITEYISYLESLFKDGMSWDNYATLWNIDHILPLKPKIGISQEETIKRLHYMNTQPLYCIENMIKQNKETFDQEISKIFENKLKVEQEEEYAEIIFIDEHEVINEIIDTYL